MQHKKRCIVDHTEGGGGRNCLKMARALKQTHKSKAFYQKKYISIKAHTGFSRSTVDKHKQRGAQQTFSTNIQQNKRAHSFYLCMDAVTKG